VSARITKRQSGARTIGLSLFYCPERKSKMTIGLKILGVIWLISCIGVAWAVGKVQNNWRMSLKPHKPRLPEWLDGSSL